MWCTGIKLTVFGRHLNNSYYLRVFYKGGVAIKANDLRASLDIAPLLVAADEDAKAYAELQRTWKEPDMPGDEKKKIEARALAIPTELVEACHTNIIKIMEFLPHCNPNITSDAKVGVHQLAGAARAAYQVSIIHLSLSIIFNIIFLIGRHNHNNLGHHAYSRLCSSIRQAKKKK